MRKALKSSAKELSHILVRGAREHNLKNVDIDIPKKKMVVITGVSGSGKSSLAFDTIFAEGQRRYMESLSSYARQFLGQQEKPSFDMIRGLAPTISIEQKAASKNPRSTVGTITEVYDYLRVLFARVGVQYCHKCGKKVGSGDASRMVSQILLYPADTKVLVLAPIVEGRKGEHKDVLDGLAREGFQRLRVDGIVHNMEDIQGLEKNKKHTIEAVVDRLVIKTSDDFRRRLTDSVETALKKGGGKMVLHILGERDIPMSEARSCCGHSFPELDPPRFSFNSPLGMCGECNGIGTIQAMDEARIVPNDRLTIREGAVKPWAAMFADTDKDRDSWGWARLKAIEEQWKINFDIPWKKLPVRQRRMILHGSKSKKLSVRWRSDRSTGVYEIEWEGMVNTLLRRYRKTSSDSMKAWYSSFMSTSSCPSCGGKRLRPDVLAVRIAEKSIMDLTALSIGALHKTLTSLKLQKNAKIIGGELLAEIVSRLGFLVNVGLDYLTLDRKGPSLSGGEAQRIRLASQIGSELTGVLYILDEPSIGLHQRDNIRLLQTLCHLRDIGNSLIVVEHDQETMELADWIVDIGPGAGRLGGEVVAEGTPAQVKRNRKSETGRFLSGRQSIHVPKERRVPTRSSSDWIEVTGASENNLKNVEVKIPLGVMTCISGVSGAGKSTLVNQILYPVLARNLHDSDIFVGKHDEVKGLENLDKVINIDQRAIGRTPRSNPATYTKLFDLIRDFYAMLPESRVRGYKKGRFSFNVKGGRCEGCQGDGYIKVEMHFLADVFVPCEDCHGRRFNEATLEVKYKSHSIADVLNLSIAEAREIFANHRKIVRILDTLLEVGMGYVKLGQSATTLSGGEAQRVKLARELAKVSTGRTLYILDEPTTGLHFSDIQNLLLVLHKLVDAGNTVVIIEHNLDVIKSCDWVVDMGPEGGDRGGRVVATGAPEKVARSKKSHTGQYLAKLFHN